MKVKKLIVDYTYEFELYGVSTSIKDYKLAWLINKKLNLALVRADDYLIELNKEELEIINYAFHTEHNELRFFKNKAVLDDGSVQKYMVAEMKHFEYFVMVSGLIHTFTSDELLKELRAIEGVQLINQIDIDTLKSRDYFLF